MSGTRHLSLLGLILALVAASALARPADKRSYASGRFTLEIDGVGSAASSRIAGGYVTADVVEQRSGADVIARKSLGKTRVEPLTVEISPGDLTALLKDTCDAKMKRYSGRIIESDVSGKVTTERTFSDAFVSEITFPALDGSAKDPARIAVTIQPQQMISSSGGKGAAAGTAEKQKQALVSNFLLTIPGSDCSKVGKIESIQIVQKSASEAVGDRRGVSSKAETGGLSFGNLVMTLPESSAKSFVDWHDDFVVKGRGGQESERTATIELLSPDMKQTIMTLEASGVGILAVRPAASSASDATRRVQVEMYVEQWRVK